MIGDVMRRLPLLLLALGLAGCSNRVISYAPLFARDRAAEASLRHGVWAAPDPGCAFDALRPIQTWPDCANPSVIAAGDFSDREFLAGGDPIIVQSRYRAAHDRPLHFAYGALEPTSRDGKGRVTGFSFWFVECGPPDLVGEGEKQARHVTKAPLPGLVVEGDNCVARTADAVRNAARASRAWSYGAVTLRWMRPRRLADRERDEGTWGTDPLGTLQKTEEAPAPAVNAP